MQNHQVPITHKTQGFSWAVQIHVVTITMAKDQLTCIFIFQAQHLLACAWLNSHCSSKSRCLFMLNLSWVIIVQGNAWLIVPHSLRLLAWRFKGKFETFFVRWLFEISVWVRSLSCWSLISSRRVGQTWVSCLDSTVSDYYWHSCFSMAFSAVFRALAVWEPAVLFI